MVIVTVKPKFPGEQIVRYNKPKDFLGLTGADVVISRRLKRSNVASAGLAIVSLDTLDAGPLSCSLEIDVRDVNVGQVVNKSR